MNQAVPEFDVVIVGAGIAGAALACALRNTDLSVALIDDASFPQSAPPCEVDVDAFDPRVCALTLASRQFLEEVDVWSGIASYRQQSFTDMQVWDAEGTGNIHFSAAEIGEDKLGYIVENRVMVYTLLAALKMSTNVKMLDGMRVHSLDYDPYDAKFRHSLQLVDEQQLVTQLKAGLVVGADGANSFVRQSCHFRVREWEYGHHAIVCTIKTEHAHQQTAWQRFMTTGPLALLPLSGNEGGGSNKEKAHYCSIVWSANVEEATRLMAMPDKAFCQALCLASEQRLGDIVACSQRFSFPLRQRHAVDYVKEGIALVADAAHTIHPLAGQGINMGLQDVQVLAEEILRAKRLHHRIGDLRVLSRYQRRRKGENLLMMASMEGFKRLFEQESLWVTWLRNRGMTGVDKVRILKQRIMKQAMGVE